MTNMRFNKLELNEIEYEERGLEVQQQIESETRRVHILRTIWRMSFSRNSLRRAASAAGSPNQERKKEINGDVTN